MFKHRHLLFGDSFRASALHHMSSNLQTCIAASRFSVYQRRLRGNGVTDTRASPHLIPALAGAVNPRIPVSMNRRKDAQYSQVHPGAS